MADDGGPPPTRLRVDPASAPPSPGGLIGLLARFGLAGLANTIVGFAVIMGLEFGLKLDPALANAGGYAVGLVLGFVLNRGFVFRSDAGGGAAARYLLAFAFAFLVNQAVLAAAHAVLGQAGPMKVAAQLSGMVVYTGLMFLVCRYWVFTRDANASTAGQSASNT